MIEKYKVDIWLANPNGYKRGEPANLVPLERFGSETVGSFNNSGWQLKAIRSANIDLSIENMPENCPISCSEICKAYAENEARKNDTRAENSTSI